MSNLWNMPVDDYGMTLGPSIVGGIIFLVIVVIIGFLFNAAMGVLIDRSLLLKRL